VSLCRRRPRLRPSRADPGLDRVQHFGARHRDGPAGLGRDRVDAQQPASLRDDGDRSAERADCGRSILGADKNLVTVLPVEVSVSDNGVGYATTGESKRHGLGLVRRLMDQVFGRVEVRMTSGTTWVLTFPLFASDEQAAQIVAPA
jgi:hypothetical protein